jgi:hypothetical protein
MQPILEPSTAKKVDFVRNMSVLLSPTFKINQNKCDCLKNPKR